jgi:hypothetical protein
MSSSRRLVTSGSPLEPETGSSRAVRAGHYVCVASSAPIAEAASTAAPATSTPSRSAASTSPDKRSTRRAPGTRVTHSQIGGPDDRSDQNVSGSDRKASPRQRRRDRGRGREMVLVTKASGSPVSRDRRSAATAPSNGFHDTIRTAAEVKKQVEVTAATFRTRATELTRGLCRNR